MNRQFGQFNLQERLDTYFKILKDHEEITTIKQLEQEVATSYQNDSSVNFSRIQRDIRTLIEKNNIKDLKSFKALRWYVNNYYLSDDVKCVKDDIIDMSYDKSSLNVYFRTKNGCAERFSQFIRESLHKFNPYVIGDFDTVWVHFCKNQQFDYFLEIVKSNFEDIYVNVEI